MENGESKAEAAIRAVVDKFLQRAGKGTTLRADPGRFLSSELGNVQVLGFAPQGFKGITNMETGKVSVSPEAQPFTLVHEIRHQMQRKRDAQYAKMLQELETKNAAGIKAVLEKGVAQKLPGFSGDTGPGEAEGQFAAYASTLPAGTPLLETPLLKSAPNEVKLAILGLIAERADKKME